MTIDTDLDDPSTAVFRALAHPVRRSLLEMLRDRPATSGELAERFAMSRFGVMKHLAILEDAGLVVVARRGRERWNHLNAAPLLDAVRRYVNPFAERSAAGLLALRDHVEGETHAEL